MARQFILPTTPVPGYAPSTVFDENNNALNRDQYLAAGGAADGSNIQRLPTLNARTGTSSSPQPVDPITQFNQNLMALLTRAQSATSKFGDNTALMADRNRVQNIQLNNSTKSAADLGIQNLSPTDMLNARQNEAQLYNPEVKSLNDRMQLNNEAVTKFSQALDSARTLGETYSKYLKPDQATIDGVIQQMKAGFIPSDAVLEKVGKFLPNDIWAQAAAAKKANSGSGSGTSVTERLLNSQQSILNSARDTLNKQKSASVDHYANPDTYRNKLSEYIAAGGTQADFNAALDLENYISPPNRKGNLMGTATQYNANQKSQDQTRLDELNTKSNNGVDLGKLNFAELNEYRNLLKK